MSTENLATESLLISNTPKELARLSACLVVSSAREAIKKRGHFDWVLSGGHSPIGLFQELASKHRKGFAWDKVRFFWSDERNVPPVHPESNFRMAAELLLTPIGCKKEQIFRIRPELGNAQKAADDYEESLRNLFEPWPRFDFMLLGVGEDGHTASLFPDARKQWEDAANRGRWVAAVWVPHLRAHRITLLPAILKSARQIVFLVSGESKARILSDILLANPSSTPKFPAQLICSTSGPSCEHKALWLADRKAASMIRKQAA